LGGRRFVRGLFFERLFRMKKQNKRLNTALLVVLVVALVAVLAVIILKQMEYGASTDFYGSLRGAL